MSFFQKLKCKLGFHNWDYPDEKITRTNIPYLDKLDRVIISFPKKCRCCEKVELCLGGDFLERVKK